MTCVRRREKRPPVGSACRILLLIAVTFLATACGDDSNGDSSGEASGGGQPPADVGFISVQPREVSITTELPGRVVAYRTAEIRPQVSGIIQERLFEEGSFVEAGQQLYQIDPARYEADYQMARANLQNAEARLNNAQTLADRYERLVESRAVSAQEYDDAQAQLIQAKAAVALAEAEVQTARIDLEYTRVYSPISGYISPSLVTEGALVTAQQERPLATVRQLDPVYVDLSQAAAEAQQVDEQMAAKRIGGAGDTVYDVTLHLGNTGRAYPETGQLDATDLAVNEQTGSIRLRSVFPNPDLILLPGLFVRATVEWTDSGKRIIVPQKSVLIEPGGGKSVWIIDKENKARKRQIRTGAVRDNNWVVLSGLNAGDRLIVEGTMMLREGAPVKPSKLEGTNGSNPDSED